MMKKLLWSAAVLASVLAFGSWRFRRRISREAEEILEDKCNPNEWVVTESMVQQLPPPVQKWLHWSGSIGKPNIHTVHLRQSGKIKFKPDQKKGFPAQAEQYSTTDYPAFFWQVKMKMLPLISVTGRDLYRFGQGELLMKADSVLPLADVKYNKKINEAALQRFLLEMAWYPSASLSPYISWEMIDERTAEAEMSYGGTTGKGSFHFEQDGRLTELRAFRYMDKNDTERTEWVGEVLEYTIYSGICLPSKLQISWMLPEGKFTWYEFEVWDVKLNERREALKGPSARRIKSSL
ncbi:DUF6920 family protein [Alkalicoccus halolimnae]|uniref:DUF6544 family protein n=1 Tax=Alkalicoccus halolimnae TaxID=1667239 RepID=A0A5C7FJI3_9BACI|nr:DUF6544 family protein [Alkalicoccus halolimnae]TXF84666.1 hypothetical protein FTX54_10730 [Alkalicoccus halolimnae]